MLFNLYLLPPRAMSLTISVQNLIYFWAVSIKNFLYVQLSPEILMLVAQDGGRMIWLTQQVKKSILSTYQLDINKLLRKLPISSIFCTNQNTITNYGVVLIFRKCHHNFIFGKVDLRAPLPPVHIREVWNYSQANAENIKYAIYNFSFD